MLQWFLCQDYINIVQQQVLIYLYKYLLPKMEGDTKQQVSTYNKAEENKVYQTDYLKHSLPNGLSNEKQQIQSLDDQLNYNKNKNLLYSNPKNKNRMKTQGDLSASYLRKNSKKVNHRKKQNKTNMSDMGQDADIRGENKKLRIFNSELKKQLAIFQRKLDQNLKKRVASERKPRVSQQKVQNMQLANAYKQIDIYKRDIANYKKKQQFYQQNKLDQLQNTITQLGKERQQFLKQIKCLKKANRIQEKRINDLGAQNISKILEEYDILKEQNRKLYEKQKKEQRVQQLAKISSSNNKRKEKLSQEKILEENKKHEEKQQSQIQILKKKLAKDSVKISYLMMENSKYRQNTENLRQQLIDKDKQCQSLRQRLNTLRKQYRAKGGSKLETQPSKQMASQSIKEQQTQERNKKISEKGIDLCQLPSSSKNGKYPRLFQSGIKQDNSFKWNHHQFSSKIKQIQVAVNIDASIKQINFRYEKGQPNRLSGSKYLVFSCDQKSDQFIKLIKGGFRDGLLQHLSLQTNLGRTHSFGNYTIAENCENFVVGQETGEYPGAFFGQNTAQGINRIGVMIQSLK